MEKLQCVLVIVYIVCMENAKTHKLVMHNDDVHDFHYIMACLIKYCEHSPIQAEQCALIAHNKGLCSIKSGDFDAMFDLKSNLNELGIQTEIEAYESTLY